MLFYFTANSEINWIVISIQSLYFVIILQNKKRVFFQIIEHLQIINREIIYKSHSTGEHQKILIIYIYILLYFIIVFKFRFLSLKWHEIGNNTPKNSVLSKVWIFRVFLNPFGNGKIYVKFFLFIDNNAKLLSQRAAYGFYFCTKVIKLWSRNFMRLT